MTDHIKPIDEEVNALLNTIRNALDQGANRLSSSIQEETNDFNDLFDQHQKALSELDDVKSRLLSAENRLIAFTKKRAEDEEDMKKIVNLTRQLQASKQSIENELKELRKMNPQALKKQVERNKEGIAKRESEIKKLNVKLNTANTTAKKAARETEELAKRVNHGVDLMAQMRHQMHQEGAIMEKEFYSEGVGYYVYRKPANIKKSFRETSGKSKLADMSFYFMVQTDAAIHFDALPLEGHDVGVPNVNLNVPDELLSYCVEQYDLARGQKLDYSNYAVSSIAGDNCELNNILNKIESELEKGYVV